MYCIYVQVVSAVLFEFLNFSYLKMDSEVKSCGEDYGNSYRRERYRRSDKDSPNRKIIEDNLGI